ncbi:MAG: site-2 protease family protein [Candidatus Acidiferrales bacterium]
MLAKVACLSSPQQRHTLSRNVNTNFDTQFLMLGVIWYVVFLFSTVCHEGAHALVGKLSGDPTAFHGGQVTLNPWPHIRREPVGMVVVPILSYVFAHWMMGWASAPYDPTWAQRYPRRAAWMALAGPGANFLLMLLAAIGIHVGMAMGAFRAPESATFTQVTQATGSGAQLAATTLSILFVLNLLLGTFNLLPFPPLDGHNGVTILMSRRAAARFAGSTFAGLGFAGLLIAWFIYDKLFPYIFSIALNLLYPGLHYG